VTIAVVAEVEECDFYFRCRIVQENSAGTGVIFDPIGHIVTNNHVVEGATHIGIILSDGRGFEAEIVGRAPAYDLAVVKIPGEGFPAVDFSDPDGLRVGDWVIAIGNALSLPGGPTVTLGIVGALDRALVVGENYLFDLIQTDAAINNGNSGGPLINLDGEVVGINTAKEPGASGIGFSVSSFTVVPVVESILEHGRVVFAALGVEVVDMTPVIASREGISAQRGAWVKFVVPGSGAAAAGILPGDVIVAINGEELDNVKDLQKRVRSYAIGEEAEVTVVRGDETKTLRVTLQELNLN
jgi:S1-C subfamily serine protease